MSDGFSWTVVIPSLNPGEALPSLAQDLLGRGADVLIVNDGSSRGLDAFEKVREFGGTVIGYGQNRGKGHALKTGFAHLREAGFGGTVVTADADGQHLPHDIERVARASHDDPSRIVLGVRDLEHMPGRSRLGNALACSLVHHLTGACIQDTQTGLRAFDAAFLTEASFFSGERYEYEMEALMSVMNTFQGVIQVPIETIYEPGNASSHFRPIQDSLSIAQAAIRVQRRRLGTSWAKT